LSGSEFGRHVLGALLAAGICLWVYHHGVVAGRAECPKCSTAKCSQVHAPSILEDFFRTD
jgi:hypothetical protein